MFYDSIAKSWYQDKVLGCLPCCVIHSEAQQFVSLWKLCFVSKETLSGWVFSSWSWYTVGFLREPFDGPSCSLALCIEEVLLSMLTPPSWLCSRQQGLFTTPITSWQLEQEAGSQWQTVKSGCFGLSLMTAPAESWLNNCAFPSKGFKWEKRKGSLTSSLPSLGIECSYSLFFCSFLEGSQLTVYKGS